MRPKDLLRDPCPPMLERRASRCLRGTSCLLLLPLLLLLSGTINLTAADAKKTAPRTLTLLGALTNTTADVSGDARLTLVLDGVKATATLKTAPPLSGSGQLEGSFRNGWLELSGKLDEGFTLQLRGALNARDYRGTYIAAVPGTPVQYGKFQLTVTR